MADEIISEDELGALLDQMEGDGPIGDIARSKSMIMTLRAQIN